MINYLDDLAGAAAETLLSAMVTDSWEALKCRFVQLVGHEKQMNAAHEEITAAAGPLRDQAWLMQKQAWRTRFGDMLDDDPDAAQSLRALLADLNAVPARALPGVPAYDVWSQIPGRQTPAEASMGTAAKYSLASAQ